MIARCRSPIAFETLVAYWADDLEPLESVRVEEHLIGCATCTAASARVAAIREAVRTQIPPVVSREAVGKLRERGLRILENPLRPGERKQAVFLASIDILLHRLGGLDLSSATRVGVTVSVEETGDVVFRDDDAPFDREAGEVLIACQKHFRSFPPNIVIAIRSSDEHGNQSEASYAIPHVFI
jgi:anti-sigma factor RsiW